MGVQVAVMGGERPSLPATPVRDSVYAVIPHLTHLTVQRAAIETLASELATEEFPLPAWRAPVFPDETAPGVSVADVLGFLFVGNTINFQFREYETGDDFAASYNGTEWTGAFGMWACLKREFDENPAIITGDGLAGLSETDVQRLFASSNGVEMPLRDARHRILTQVSDTLVEHYDGEASEMVDAANSSCVANGTGLVERIVAEFPSFEDTASLSLPDQRSVKVRFWKRAQLAAAMMYGRFHDSDVSPVTDIEALTVFADYHLPNILREFGVLAYSESLAEQIDAGVLLAAGSRKEAELRAATIYASDVLIEAINRRRDSPIYAPRLDYKLFSLRDDVLTPVHLTRTTAY